ncbi:MAG: amidohydrolase family protein, partial [Saprospiraceae bacterium]|nr:amidohydrolase family protein [Saprospiraceae bacterium]
MKCSNSVYSVIARSCTMLALVLMSAQAISAQAPFSDLVQAFIHTQDPVIALRNATVVDGTGGPVQYNQTILISNGRIAAVGPAAELPMTESATVIDCRGKTVIPGFVMLHEHMFYSTPFKDKFSVSEMPWTFPRMYLAGGATTIRTAGSIQPLTDLNMKKWIQRGEMPGPDMDVTSPFITSEEVGIPQINPLLEGQNPAELVNFWADQGVTSFKVYVTITREDLKQVVEAAHARGLKVTGHLCSVTYREAAEIGIDDLEHGFYMASDFIEDKLPDMCDPFARSRTLRSLDVESAQMKALMQVLIEHQVAVTSTLPVFVPYKDREIVLGGGFDALEQDFKQKLSVDHATRAEREQPATLAYFQKQMAWEKQFYDMGGLLVAGTDPTGAGRVIAGYANQYIPELFVEAGFSIPEAIRICTLHGAIYLERDDEIGTIEAGKRADLILLDGDLSQEISKIRNIEIVFKNGVGFDS